MGRPDTPLNLGNAMELHLPPDVYVVADAARLAGLEAAVAGVLAAHPGHGLTTLALPADAPVPDEAIRSARILVIEIDSASQNSLARVSQVRAVRPDLPLIVALEDASVSLVRTLVRQGVTDVAALPFDAGELFSQLLDADAQNASEVSGDLAPMVAVVGGSGGTGATTAITHLGPALSEAAHDARVCIVDLDVQFGDVAAYLGQGPVLTVGDLLEAGDRLDSEYLRGAAKDSGKGVWFISAPGAIAPLESVDIDQLLKVLDLVRREFDFVLLDLPANWTNWTLSAALACDRIVLVTQQTIPCLRQARRMIDMFGAVGVERGAVQVVVNRAEKKLFQTISVSEVAKALDHDVLATLAADPQTIEVAQDQGALAWDISRRSRYVADIRALANALVGESGGHAA